MRFKKQKNELAFGTREKDGLAFVGRACLTRRVSHVIVATLGTLAIHHCAHKVLGLESFVGVLAASRLVYNVDIFKRLSVPV
jgi:hypothetical protein